jgi:hypothetical protein
MSDNTKNFIDKLSAGDQVAAGDAFTAALRDKVGSALETKRQEFASNLFNGPMNADGQPETSHSDPKPEVLSPNIETNPSNPQAPEVTATGHDDVQTDGQ